MKLLTPTKWTKTSSIVAILLLQSSLLLNASVYNLEESFQGRPRKLRLNIPESIENDTIRAVFIVGNGAGRDQTNLAENPEFVAFAEHYGLAILATGHWGNFSQSNDSEIELLESMIAQFSRLSGHPELVHAPWLPTGHSNGGQMSYGLNTKRPNKTIAFITGSGGYYNNLTPSVESLSTPGLIICGENDRQYRKIANRKLFENNRPRGALWSWTEQEGSAHQEGESRNIKLAFLEECLRLRYPHNQTPLNGPIKLKQLDEFQGWLVDPTTWNHGDLVEIHQADKYDAPPYNMGWVPNERVARLYQSYSTYEKIADHLNIKSSMSPLDSGATYTYAPILNRDDWTKIEFFLDGEKVSEVLASSGAPSLEIEIAEGGFHFAYAIATLSDGSQRSTAVRTFFQIGEQRKNDFEKWIRSNQPTSMTLLNPSIDPKQFINEQGNSSLYNPQYPYFVSRVKLEQDEYGNTRYIFDLVCKHTDINNDFIYRLHYAINSTEMQTIFQSETKINSYSLQSLTDDSGPRFDLSIPDTFEGIWHDK